MSVFIRSQWLANETGQGSNGGGGNMSKFKVGDICIRYNADCGGDKFSRMKCTLISFNETWGFWKVAPISDGSKDIFHYAHPKQLRKLVKKPRREFWLVRAYMEDNFSVLLSNPSEGIFTDIIHVREVREKK